VKFLVGQILDQLRKHGAARVHPALLPLPQPPPSSVSVSGDCNCSLPICMRRRTATTLLLMLAAFLVPSAVAT
jgi:hypothetical protein